MSTIVYHNLVPCFENQFKETATTIKLKFAAAAAATPANLADMSTSLEYGNWGLLQTHAKEPLEKNSFCTQRPSSFSRLSAKSLELCTENLGSESGSDVITDCSSNDSIFSRSSSFSHSNLIEDSSPYSRFEAEKPKLQEAISSENPRQAGMNTTKRSNDFPPPLTSMCRPSSLQMRRRREGGRLIIDAVEAPFRNSYLQAERSDGRLRLCFSTGSGSAVTTTSTIYAIAEEQQQSEDECGGEQTEPEETDELQTEIESGKEEFEGDINYEMDLEKFQRFSRCKEGGHGSKGLCSVWKPACCVAT